MAKNIVLLSDGTGNSSGKLFKTNVWRLYQALDLSESSASKQIAYYDDGVGTSSFKPMALVGGAFGWGLKRNVIDLYTFLCWNYEQGDKIYAFGFSRGAFTIRVLTGLIVDQGLVQATSKIKLKKLALQAFRDYRRAHFKTISGIEQPCRALRDMVIPNPELRPVAERSQPQIRFLGLWDTVAAYGLPIDELTRAFNSVFPLSTPDRNLSNKIERACHAVALDDERNTFHPVLWNEADQPQNDESEHVREERISQVWFTGMHANVGGGYADDALSYVSLNWMIQEAQHAGLSFKSQQLEDIKNTANTNGKLYNSRHGVGGVYRYLPRKLSLLTHTDDITQEQVIIDRPKIHHSVFDRISASADGYAPFNLPDRYAVVGADGSIVDIDSDKSGATDSDYLPLEHSTQAQHRANQQESIWNLVWYKRVAYFSNIGLAFVLLLFPLLFPAGKACSGLACALVPIFDKLSSLLPSFAKPWFDAFSSHPGKFLTIALLSGILLYINAVLRGRMFDQMRMLWKKTLDDPAREFSGSLEPPNDWLYKFRNHPTYQAFFKLMKRWILPWLFGLIAVYLIVAAISQGLFALMNAGGWVCADMQAKTINQSASFFFSSNILCNRSGIELKQGNRYSLTIQISKDQLWKDASINAELTGLKQDQVKWPMHLALPFRRHVQEPWFKPIAKFGAYGTSEVSLNFEIKEHSEKNQIWTTEITPLRDGQLFLFVNDAILPVPKNWQVFYKNNKGKISVTVEVLPPLSVVMCQC